MAQDLGMLTNMWMVDPTMFDPTQKSNQFSNFNNNPFPWPPSYNTGAGGPVNAATGKPIASFQQWQQQNPGGMSLNATPAQPQAAPAPYQLPQGLSPQQQRYQSNAYNNMIGAQMSEAFPQQNMATAPAAAPQASGPPNNWQAAINALANPGNPVTQGANVPLATGYQPAGGVNQAFLNQAGAGQGMNQGFLSALRAIQGRPQ